MNSAFVIMSSLSYGECTTVEAVRLSRGEAEELMQELKSRTKGREGLGYADDVMFWIVEKPLPQETRKE